MYQHARANEITMRRLLPEPLPFNCSLLPAKPSQTVLPSPQTYKCSSNTNTISGIKFTYPFQAPENGTTTTTPRITSPEGQSNASPDKPNSKLLGNPAQANELSVRVDASVPQPTSSRLAQEAAVNVSLPPLVVPLTMDTAVLQGARVIVSFTPVHIVLSYAWKEGCTAIRKMTNTRALLHISSVC